VARSSVGVPTTDHDALIRASALSVENTNPSDHEPIGIGLTAGLHCAARQRGGRNSGQCQ
jgi:hypothetical protein